MKLIALSPMIVDQMVDKLGPIITILHEHPAISRDAGSSLSLPRERGERERGREIEMNEHPVQPLKLGIARKGCCHGIARSGFQYVCTLTIESMK